MISKTRKPKSISRVIYVRQHLGETMLCTKDQGIINILEVQYAYGRRSVPRCKKYRVTYTQNNKGKFIRSHGGMYKARGEYSTSICWMDKKMRKVGIRYNRVIEVLA